MKPQGSEDMASIIMRPRSLMVVRFHGLNNNEDKKPDYLQDIASIIMRTRSLTGNEDMASIIMRTRSLKVVRTWPQ